MDSKSILIAGVGGQGTLLASKLLGRLLPDLGNDVKVSEVHGMSQRGGSVVTYVRCGEKVYSPVIDKGGADIILAFEPLEAARWFEYLKPGGTIVLNTARTMPMSVLTGQEEYPEGVIEKLSALGAKVDALDALKAAEEAGSPKAVNIVLLGLLSRSFDIAEEKWLEAIEALVPAKLLEMNKKAFSIGRNA
jgi:indolepyruvate ferredoxin oxidoreductase beta subunit